MRFSGSKYLGYLILRGLFIPMSMPALRQTEAIQDSAGSNLDFQLGSDSVSVDRIKYCNNTNKNPDPTRDSYHSNVQK